MKQVLAVKFPKATLFRSRGIDKNSYSQILLFKTQRPLLYFLIFIVLFFWVNKLPHPPRDCYKKSTGAWFGTFDRNGIGIGWDGIVDQEGHRDQDRWDGMGLGKGEQGNNVSSQRSSNSVRSGRPAIADS